MLLSGLEMGKDTIYFRKIKDVGRSISILLGLSTHVCLIEIRLKVFELTGPIATKVTAIKISPLLVI
jgi:hypothetical protein